MNHPITHPYYPPYYPPVIGWGVTHPWADSLEFILGRFIWVHREGEGWVTPPIYMYLYRLDKGRQNFICILYGRLHTCLLWITPRLTPLTMTFDFICADAFACSSLTCVKWKGTEGEEGGGEGGGEEGGGGSGTFFNWEGEAGVGVRWAWCVGS